jgi:tripartite-type tricarboxylate transporter receptor subunit TctC
MRLKLAAILLVLPSLCIAQALTPGKPVRLIVPAAPGGNPDVLGRMLGQKLQASVGISTVVDNQPGGGGVAAAILVAKSPPDGHTLFLGGSSVIIGLSMNPSLPVHPVRDFSMITSLATVPTVLVVNPTVPANNVREFIAFAKERPGKVDFGSAGVGSTHHLTMAVFAAEAGIKVLHIPYKGGTPLVAAVMAGEVHAGFSGIPNVIQAVRAGKLKVLGISLIQRSKSMPDVPTLDEQGLKGFDLGANIGVQTASGLPRALVTMYQSAFARAIREKDVLDRMALMGMDLTENGTDDYEKRVRDEVQRFTAVIKSEGIRPD